MTLNSLASYACRHQEKGSNPHNVKSNMIKLCIQLCVTNYVLATLLESRFAGECLLL